MYIEIVFYIYNFLFFKIRILGWQFCLIEKVQITYFKKIEMKLH